MITRLLLSLLLCVPLFAAWVPPVGIPDPADYWEGLDPMDDVAPPWPANWPSAEAAGYYYIHPGHAAATDTANTYGYPDKPRSTIPNVTFAAGSYVELHGTYSLATTERTFNGTAENPCWFRGDGINNPNLGQSTAGQDFVFKGTYLFVENLNWGPGRLQIRARNNAGSGSHIVIRNCTGTGNGTGTGAAIGISGQHSDSPSGDEVRFQYNVLYNNTIHGYGDWESVDQSDYHAMQTGSYSDYTWFVDNTAYEMGGDGVQVGANAGTPLAVEPYVGDYVFIGRNTFYSCGENGVDVKFIKHVVISENYIHDIPDNKTSASGDAVAVHYDPVDVWILNNRIENGDQPIRTSGVGGILAVVGNRITGGNDYAALFYGGSTELYFAHNTITHSHIGLQIYNTLTSATVYNNIFTSITNQAILWDNSGDHTYTTVSNICVYGTGATAIQYGATTYGTLAAWMSATGKGDGSISDDPLLDADGYSLTVSSPCIGAAMNASGLQTLFSTSMGYALTWTDYGGTTRANDIGADEYAAEAPASRSSVGYGRATVFGGKVW